MFTLIESIKALHSDMLNSLCSDAYADGTYNLETLEPVSFDDGFQVSFCNVGDNYSADDYLFICSMFSEVSSDGIVYAGKYDGTAEISFHFSDKLTAIKYAKKFNQISIWDWKACDEIKTGGTGKR